MILRAARYAEAGPLCQPVPPHPGRRVPGHLAEPGPAGEGAEGPASGCARLCRGRRLAVDLPLRRVRHPSDAPFRAGVRRRLRWRGGRAQDRRSRPHLPSVDQIAFAARTFVLRNPAQIQKQIVPAGTATEPAIRIVTCPRARTRRNFPRFLPPCQPPWRRRKNPRRCCSSADTASSSQTCRESAAALSAAEDQLQDHPRLEGAGGRSRHPAERRQRAHGVPVRDRRRPPAVSGVAGGGGVPERRRAARHVCRDDPGPPHPDDPRLERAAIVLCHRAQEGSRLRHRRSTWRWSWRIMAAANAVGGCWASPGRMAASGIAASMSSIAETCCPPANPAEPLCHAAPMEYDRGSMWLRCQLSDAARNAKMAGWSNAVAVMESSSAASAIRPVSGKRKYRAVNGPPSRSRDAETGPDMRCASVPMFDRDRRGGPLRSGNASHSRGIPGTFTASMFEGHDDPPHGSKMLGPSGGRSDEGTAGTRLEVRQRLSVPLVAHIEVWLRRERAPTLDTRHRRLGARARDRSRHA
jgi:hypothetical protein